MARCLAQLVPGAAWRRGWRPSVGRPPAARQPLAWDAPQQSRGSRVSALQTVRLAGDNEGDELACEVEVGEGGRLLTFSLAKPMGLYLAEKSNGDVVVDEVVLGGNASGSGIELGDAVRAVTARSQEAVPAGARTAENLYSSRTKGSLFGRLVVFRTEGESFDTVMAAIASNKCSQCEVQLVVERRGAGE